MITRFAPSPTGPLHLGHAFSAVTAFDLAKAAKGTFLLRIEDIDQTRSRPEWEDLIYEDLHWLGLEWPTPVLRQSERAGAYTTALDRLKHMGLTYRCICSRRDVIEAASAPQEGARVGPDGVVYPGSCKHAGHTDPLAAIRLHMDRAMERAGSLYWVDRVTGPHVRNGDDMIRRVGDVVLARKAMGTSYHLSVVVDDAAQGVTEVVRGADLEEATPIHVLLQHLLGFSVPTYHHHRLIRDQNGKRLAKRDDARAIATYRAEGVTPQDMRALVGL